MVAPRNRARTLEIPANPNHHNQMKENGENQNQENQKGSCSSGYEQFREERIKENLERMQKLGIFDLSLRIKSTPKHNNRINRSSINRKTPQCLSPPLPPRSESLRRSSRLQNSTPVSYSEVPLTKKDKDEDYLLGEGSRPEVYTEEHEKLLGNTEMSWTLFVDGCGKDGRRIYDPVRGKTCHQCRQKTLGLRTHCSQCNLVQGQFCGDCLYMRYGEHVVEANQNPNWICPVCRGICNCSLCRHAKGWPATGCLYKKISKLGYKSVAHYLIQTQSETELSKNSGTKVPVSAKRSLPFSDAENALEEKGSFEYNDDKQRRVTPKCEDNRTDDLENVKKEEITFPDIKNGDVSTVMESSKEEKEEKMQCLDCKDGEYFTVTESTPEIKNKPAFTPEPNPGSIAGHEERMVGIADIVDIEESVKNGSSEKEAEANMGCLNSTSPSVDSIAEIHKSNGDNGKRIGMNEGNPGINQAVNTKSSKNEAEAKKGSSILTSPSVDSIAGRLRLRRLRN